MKKLFLSLFATLSAALAQSPTELPPLVVGADPSETRLPSFSTSTTRLSSADLAQRGASHFQDALGMVPNLHFAGATSRPRYLQLRGIGERSQFSAEGPPNFSVGVLQDEIDLSGLAGALSLFDVSTVDVLRGPQATLYGSRALAGLVLVTSTPPSRAPEGLLHFGLGTDELFEAGAVSSGPWSASSETLYYRLSLHLLRQDGFRDNSFLDRDSTNRRLESNARFQLLWEPDSGSTHHLTLLGSRLNNGYDAFATDGDGFHTRTDEPGKDTLGLFGASLRSTFTQPRAFDLVSISSATRADSGYGYDADWGNDAFWAAPPYAFDPAVEGYRYSFTEQLDRLRNQVSQEIRFQGKPDERIFADRSAWSSGLALAWMEEIESYAGFSRLDARFESLTSAGYGQLTTELSPAVDLVTSLRLEHRGADYNDSENIEASTTDWMSGGRVALETQLRPGTRGFVGLSRGYKGGGVNANPNLPPERRAYEPETLWNLETGLRSHWADGRGSAGLTLFHMWRRDLQVGTSLQPNPADPTSFTYFTDNAAEGRNLGLELDLRAPLHQRLDFFGSLGLLDTEYRNFEDAGGNLNLDGREQPHAPSYTFRAGLEMSWTEHWFSRAEIEGRDAFLFSDGNDSRSDPHELVHLSFGYRWDSGSFTLWGRNVFDTRYATRGYSFGIEPPDYPERLWTTQGDPAQFGITWTQRF